MARLRVVQFDIEDASDSVVRAALGGLRLAGLAGPATEMAASLEAPAAELAPPMPAKPRKALAAPAPARTAAPLAEGMRQAPGGGVTIRQQIMNLLKKKPTSSIEIARALNLEPKQSYQSCAAMKAAGLIEGVTDEADGTRLYRIVDAK